MCILFFAGAIVFSTEPLVLDIGDWEPFTSSRDVKARALEKLVREVFELSNIDVKYRYYPWLRSYENVRNGYGDGCFPIIRNPEREQEVLFSKEVILVEDTVFFHLKDLKFSWKNFDDLKNYRIGATIGYAYMEPLVNDHLNVEYVPYEDLNFKKLLAGHIDIYPASLHVGIYLIHRLFSDKEAQSFTYDPKPLNRQKYYFIVSKKDTDAGEILNDFDSGLRELKKNGRYDEIMDDLTQ